MSALQSSLEEAREEGEETGIEKGIEKGKEDCALKMLEEGVNPHFVAKCTGLKKSQVDKLKKSR